jgi:hypothetical protein
LNFKIPRDRSWVSVSRRERDNLPDKIKGQARWLETKDKRGYMANRGTRQLPVEFINEHWYILHEGREGFVINTNNKQGRINKLGLGSLPKQKKPQMVILTGETPSTSTSKGKEVKVITRGLHHVVTTQGTNPLTEEKPPHIMQGIEEHVKQRGEVPINVPPTGAIYATMTTNMPLVNVISDRSRGSLKEDPPSVFDGTRSKAKTFRDEFVIYWKINKNNASMKEPLT